MLILCQYPWVLYIPQPTSLQSRPATFNRGKLIKMFIKYCQTVFCLTMYSFAGLCSLFCSLCSALFTRQRTGAKPSVAGLRGICCVLVHSNRENTHLQNESKDQRPATPIQCQRKFYPMYTFWKWVNKWTFIIIIIIKNKENKNLALQSPAKSLFTHEWTRVNRVNKMVRTH